MTEIEVHYLQLRDVGDEGFGYWDVSRMLEVSRESVSIRQGHEDAVREVPGATRVARSAFDGKNLGHQVDERADSC